ncbi:MAG: nuclear transport factor 2 family protein [Actinomycetota bacterium]|nr:nuclear transport factor 2 family protein [Actinomycetota bacterium]
MAETSRRTTSTDFAQRWLEGWNSHDVEAVLAHFADDVVFRSPVAARLLPDSNGVIRGKDELRRYWTEALRQLPDLHFELLGVYSGVDTVVIHYGNQKRGLVNEVLVFGDGLVREGYATYLGADDNAAAPPEKP